MRSAHDTADLKKRLELPASELARLLMTLPSDNAITDVLDYVIGALYGLMRAIDMGFVDRPAGWHSMYRTNIAKYVGRVLRGDRINDRWVAGFYFNSAIQRIAACFDRIPKLLQAKGNGARARMGAANSGTYTKWGEVYEEINGYKHDPSGRAAGRSVTLEDAITAFGEVMAFLKASEVKLRSPKS